MESNKNGRTIVKVLVLGAANVGKSSLVERYVGQTFQSTRRATVGCELKSKKIQVSGEEIALQVWDTAGEEKFSSTLGSSYFRNADGACLVYDCSNHRSVDQLSLWRDEAISKVVPDIEFPIVVVANKVDLRDDEGCSDELKSDINVTVRLVVKWCGEHGYGHVECSAKEGSGVEAAMLSIAALALQAHKAKPLFDDGARPSFMLQPRDVGDLYSPQQSPSCVGGHKACS